MTLYNKIITILTTYNLNNLIRYFQHDTYQTMHVTIPPDYEQLAYSKHVEDVVKNRTQKVHLVGSII